MARRTATRKLMHQGPFPTETVFLPRSYQKPLIQAFSIDLQTRRPRTRNGLLVEHRRGGKSIAALCGVAISALTFRPGNYFHFFPTFAQGKKILWDGKETQTGRPFLDRFPRSSLPEFNETEMQVKLHIGQKEAIYQIVGADDIQTVSKLVGTGPFGIIYDEAGLIDEEVPGLFQPVLAENGGWQLFIGTPRGKNQFYRRYLMARETPGWYCGFYTIRGTKRDAPGEDGQPVVTEEEVERQIREGLISRELAEQEYYCSWEGYGEGTIYGDLLRDARRDGRVCHVPYNPNLPVGTMWDIGRSDGTAILFYQCGQGTIRIIDYAFDQGKDAPFYAHLLKEQKPYQYTKMILPWEAETRHGLTTEWSVMEYFERVGFRGVMKANKMPLDGIQGGIEMVRRNFRRFVFDEGTCSRPPVAGNEKLPSLLDALGNYHRGRSASTGMQDGPPVHDVNSHAASALMTGVVGGLEPLEFISEQVKEIKVETAFDPRQPMGQTAVKGPWRGWGE